MKRLIKYGIFLILLIIVRGFLISISGSYSFMEFENNFVKGEVGLIVVAVAVWLIPYLYIFDTTGNEVKKIFNELAVYFLTREYRVNKLIILLIKKTMIDTLGFIIVALIFTWVTQGNFEMVLSNSFRLMMWVIICVCINVVGYKSEVAYPMFIGVFFVMTQLTAISDSLILNNLFLNMDTGWFVIIIFIGIGIMSILGMIKTMQKIDF